MNLLKNISDIENGSKEIVKYSRKSAIGIMFDDNNLIPILFVSNHNYHKLPGGGIERGETNSEALIREFLEETGCTINIKSELGKVVEYRSKTKFKQTSYAYYGNVIKKGVPSFSDKEINKGFKLLWMTLNDAISKISSDATDNYSGKFSLMRDMEYLKKYKEIMEKN